MAIRPIGMLRYGFDQLPDGPGDDSSSPAPYEPPKQEDEYRSPDDEKQQSYQPQVQQPQTFAQMQEAGYARPPMPTGPAPQLTTGGSSAMSLAPRDNTAGIMSSTPATAPAAGTVNDAFTVLYGDQADAMRQQAASTGVPPTAAQAWSMFTGTPEQVAEARNRYNAFAGSQLDSEAEREAIQAADNFAAGPGYFAGEEGLQAPEGAQSRLDYISDYIRQARPGTPGVPSFSVVPTNQTPGSSTPSNPSQVPNVTGGTNNTNTDPRYDIGSSDGYTPNTSGGFDIWDYISGNLQGGGSPLSQSVTNRMLEFLNNPNPYGAQEVKDAYSWLGGQIDDEYALKEKRLGEEMARRRLGGSTYYGGRLQDLNVGRRSAKEGLARDLASNFANSYGQNVLGALNLGNTIDRSGRESQQSWLDRLVGFGQQAFENDLATEGLNQRASEAYQNWILGLLSYGAA